MREIRHGSRAYARRESRMRFRQYPNGHRLRRSTHVQCSMFGCPFRAEYVEYCWHTIGTRPATAGISFSHYCADHWDTTSPGIASSPRERATAGGAS